MSCFLPDEIFLAKFSFCNDHVVCESLRRDAEHKKTKKILSVDYRDGINALNLRSWMEYLVSMGSLSGKMWRVRRTFKKTKVFERTSKNFPLLGKTS